MRTILPMLVLLFVISCTNRFQIPLTKGKSENNKTYDVEYLFEHDGCKVYRFYDRGNCVYFTNCRGEAIAKRDSTEERNRIWK